MDDVAAWQRLVDGLYPESSAASWDNVGLQVGDPAWPVDRVMVTLDVTSAVIEEAAAVEGTLVLAHHPLLFRPLASLTPDTASGRTALAAAAARVAVLAVHSNLDIAIDGAGTSQPVADVLGLVDRRPLTTEPATTSYKLVTFVPTAHVDAVIDAMAAAGAGTIGDYERCAFRLDGIGTFTPGAGTNPHTGTIGEVNNEPEWRVEMVVPAGAIGDVVRAMRSAHPYEEVAWDLYPLAGLPRSGLGIVGRLTTAMPLRAVANLLREDLPSPHLRVAGERDRLVHRVAVVGGAGDSLVGAAMAAGVDLYVTGDLRHHVTLDALELGLALIDAGHHGTEHAAMAAWRDRLEAAAHGHGLSAPLVVSSAPTDPWSA